MSQVRRHLFICGQTDKSEWSFFLVSISRIEDHAVIEVVAERGGDDNLRVIKASHSVIIIYIEFGSVIVTVEIVPSSLLERNAPSCA